ncbi:MAG: hypothetical protein JO103_11615, partial [Candidatus Eremiobacteraeota bacterium]|nr:hypothetical protein [Candidatus Eremiobacteraeota bacterium]
VTELELTVKVTVAEAPPAPEIVAEHVPAFSGVTVSVKESPDPDGVPKLTIALAPLPHVDEIAGAVIGTLVVIVTVWLYGAPPGAEKVSEDGVALSVPAGAGVPVFSGGGFAPPP